MNLANYFNQQQFDKYVAYLKGTGLTSSSIQRKLSSIATFQKFLIKKGIVQSFPIIKNISIPKKNKFFEFLKNFSFKQIPQNSKFYKYLLISSLIIIVSGIGITLYRQAITKAKKNLAYTTSSNPIYANRFLSFQGRLTDSAGNPITSSTNIVFDLYNTENVGTGTSLYTSSTGNSQVVIPDDNGIFSVTIGKTHGTEIPNSVFTENSAVYLQITAGGEVMDPRQPIATVAYAVNSESLQGLQPSASGLKNTVLVIDNDGNLNLGETSPTIKSTSGILGIEGQSILLTASNGSGGDIEINPDANGIIKLTTEGSGSTAVGGFINATNANLSAGNLFNASINNTNRGYNFISFNNYDIGTTHSSTRFSVDAYGNTLIGGTLSPANISIGNTLLISSAYELNLLDGLLPTSGSIIYGNGSNLTNSSIGTSGQVLTSNGTSAPVWINSDAIGKTYTAGVGMSLSLDNVFSVDYDSSKLALNGNKLTLNLGSTNTWTGLQNFSAGATISNLSVGGTFISVGSTNLITNLNANYLNGIDSNGFLQIGNTGSLPYVNNATDSTLIRSGSGPYTLGLNLGSTNVWLAPQIFTNGIGVTGTTNLTNNLNVGGTAYFAGNLKIGTTAFSNYGLLVNNHATIDSLTFYNSQIYSNGADLTLTGGGTQSTRNNINISNGGGGISLNTTDSSVENISLNVRYAGGYILLNGGDVGIGTTSPTEKLHVVGNEYLSGNLTIGGTFVSVGSTNLVTNLNANYLNGIASSGFVGIGQTGNFITTLNNGVGISISGSGVGRTIAVDYDATKLALTGNKLTLNLGATNVWTALTTFTNGIGVSGTTNLTNNLNVGGTAYFANNVGIGTTDITGKFTVAGSSGSGRSVSIDNREIKFRGDGVAHMSILGPDTGNSFITFQNTSANSATGTAGTDLFTILSSGNIGIGTTNPSQKLQITTSGANDIQYGIRLQNPNNSTTGASIGIAFANDTDNNLAKGALVYTGRDGYGKGDFLFLQNTDNDLSVPTLSNAVMAITNGGFVGIGITNPTSKLTIVGDANISTNLNVGGTLTLSQGAQNGYVLTSDASGHAYWGVGNTSSGTTYTASTGITLVANDIQLNLGYTPTWTGLHTFTNGIGVSNSANFTGNIGVGITASPTTRLTIAGSGSTKPVFTLLNDDNSVNLEIRTDTTNKNNTFIGIGVGSSGSGMRNTGVGYESLLKNSRDYNTAFGYRTLYNNAQDHNSAFGYQSMYTNAGGWNNNAFGSGSLYSNSNGNDNTAIGYYSLNQNTTGDYNTAIGNQAISANTTGSYNTAIGYLALDTGSTLTGNIALGYGAGKNLSVGSSNIFIGNNVGESGSYNNRLYIGNGQNPIIFGDLSNGRIGLGTTAPGYKLDVVGDGSISTNLNVGGTLTLSQGAQNGYVLTSDASGHAYWGVGNTSSGTTYTASTGITLVANDIQLNLGYTPVWTGLHTFTNGIGVTGTATFSNDINLSNNYINNGTQPGHSNFVGYYAGYGATSASYSNFFGINAGINAVNAYSSNFFGYQAGVGASNASGSNFFGYTAGKYASSALNSNFYGYQSGLSATNASSSNFFGEDTGKYATNANNSNFFGKSAGVGATNAANSIFIGSYAGYNDSVNTGSTATAIAIGRYAGTGGFKNSIALGRGVINTADQQVNIGNVLYLSSIYNSDTQSGAALAAGKVGIGTTNPTSTLTVAGDGSFSTNLNVGGTLTLSEGAQNGYVLTSDASGHAYWGVGNTSSGTTYTAGNGLTLASNTFKLGGLLTENTSIGTSSFSLSFLGLGNSQSLHLASSGRVGIGITASPTAGQLLSIGSLISANSIGEIRASSFIDSEDNTAFLDAANSSATAASLSLYATGSIRYNTSTSNTHLITGAASRIQSYSNGLLLGVSSSTTGSISGWDSNLFLASSGNIGIGTTNPTHKLSIAGASSSISNTSGDITINSASNNISFSGDSIININNGLFAGSIGIGTTNPSALLEISNGTSSDTKMHITNSSSGNIGIELRGAASSSQQYIDFTNNSISNTGVGSSDYTNRIISNNTGFYLKSPSQSFISMINSSGNVGIGTTNPATKLQIALNTSGAQPRILSLTDTTAFPNTKSLDLGFDNVGNYGYIQSTIYSTSWNNLAINPNGGNVSIGTTNPQAKLHVASDNGTYNQFIVRSQASNAAANTTLEALGIYNYSLGLSSTGLYQYYTDSSNVARVILTTGTAIDLAEWYKVGFASLDSNGNSTLKKGELLCTDPNDNEKVVACSSTATKLIGIVSTNPYQTMGMNDLDDDHHDATQVALTGRVPLITTIQNNQQIKNGDPLTSSNLIGTASKPIKAGPIAAKSLENTNWNSQTCPTVSSVDQINWPHDDGTNSSHPCYVLPDGTIVGKIMAFVNISWYDPNIYITTTGQIDTNFDLSSNTLASLGYQSIEDEINSANYTLTDTNGNIVTEVSQFKEIASAKIKAGLISVKNIIADNILVKNLVAQKIKTDELKSDNIISPLGSIDHLTTQDIQSTTVETENLIAQNIQTEELNSLRSNIDDLRSNNATISGTLYADNIISKEGSFGDIMTNKISSLREELQKIVAKNEATPSALLAESSNWYADIASDSATINGDLNLSDNLIVGAQLLVNGDTQLGNTFINGIFNAGQIAIQDNFIETTNTALYIQPSQTGSVHIMGDTLIIADNGDVTINGNLSITGSFAARNITADEITTNKLTAYESILNDISSTKINIATDSASTIIASDTDINIATSSAKVNSNATAGTATLPAGKTELIISTDKVTTNSMVYLTPLGSTQNQVLYVKSKDISEIDSSLNSFTISLDNPLTQDLSINWWIIN